MGGPGSGRATGKEERQAAAAAAKAKRTTETSDFLNQEALQKGDRLFKVVRVYPSGHKASLGTLPNPKDATLGAMFGGGVYELHELDRATEYETGKILKKTLHPSTYPPKKQFAKDPHELDLEGLAEDRATAGPSPAAGGLAGLSREEMFAKAKAEAKAEFMREETQRQLERRLAELDAKLERMANGDFGGAQRRTPLEEIASMFEMFKKFMPPPTPNLGGANLSAAQQLQESMELIKGMRGALKELGGEDAGGKITPMGEKLLSSLTDLAQRGFQAWERTQGGAGGARVIDAPAAGGGWARTDAPAPAPAPHVPPAAGGERALYGAGWANTKPRPAAAPAAPEAPAAPSNWPKANPNYTATRADFGTDEEWSQFQEDAMTYELVEFVKKEMAGIIAGEPGFSVFRTAEQIRGRWTVANASPAWLKLRDGMRSYDTAILVNHFCGLQPDLCPTQRHRDCLAALIDVIKDREGVKQ